jgi:hypothetical protein
VTSRGDAGEVSGSAHGGEEPRVAVHLQRYPLRIGARATQHYNDVFREFALMAGDTRMHSEAAPVRLMALVEALGRRYERQEQHEEEREAALQRGETERDLVIEVPVSVGEAGRQLDEMLDETDDFCRDGTLLTLQAPDDVTAFRRWYLRELRVQAGGGAPTPWPGSLS